MRVVTQHSSLYSKVLSHLLAGTALEAEGIGLRSCNRLGLEGDAGCSGGSGLGRAMGTETSMVDVKGVRPAHHSCKKQHPHSHPVNPVRIKTQNRIRDREEGIQWL